MTPYKHAMSTVSTHGGIPEDYCDIHNWFDETKAYTGDWTHRALRHHSAGVEWCIKLFGWAIRNSDGKMVPVKLIAEQHVTEDCGFIPTPQDWLACVRKAPEAWMLKVAITKTTKIKYADGNKETSAIH